jgi:triosephosphate isomerase (TIM)
MKRALIVGNWKMHGNLTTALALAESVRGGAKALAGAAHLVICPPYVYLPQLAHVLAGSGVQLGAQNCGPADQGAYTGEVSAAMLAELGCSWVLLGHSERRQLFGESDATLVGRLNAALEHGLRPVFCVGEQLEDRAAGRQMDVVAAQLEAVLSACRFADWPRRLVVAYEPVWAIGTGQSATAQDAQSMHQALRELLRGWGAEAASIPVLYGGSVRAGNASELLAQPDVDGVLVGGASLDSEEFLAIAAGAATAS